MSVRGGGSGAGRGPHSTIVLVRFLACLRGLLRAATLTADLGLGTLATGPERTGDYGSTGQAGDSGSAGQEDAPVRMGRRASLVRGAAPGGLVRGGGAGSTGPCRRTGGLDQRACPTLPG